MKALAEQILELDSVETYGRVVGVRGLLVEVAGPIHVMSVGARVLIDTGTGRSIPCEVIGFSGPNALLMPFSALEGVRRGCKATVSAVAAAVRPSKGWLGGVVNLLRGPAHGHLGRIGRRQVGAAVHACPQRRGRCFGDWPRRRARPRGAGI